MKRRYIYLQLIALIFLTVSARAWGFYEQSMDADWLTANATFPSRTPLLVNNGNSILFEESGVIGRWFDVLIEVPLPDFGTLPSGTTVSIDIDATPLPSKNSSYLDDEELHIGITDGTSIVAFTRVDNDNGTGALFEGTYGTPQAWLDTVDVFFSNAGRPSAFSTVITLKDLETIVWGQIGSSSASATASSLISLNSPLSIVVVGDNSWEEYQINSIGVSVVPEPTTLLLLALGGLALLKKRRA